MDDTPENTSGQGKSAIIPEEVKGWNWGAFVLTWIWGLFNSVWIALLVFIPLFGFIWCFVVGAKGNEWAWRKRKWDSIEHFKRTQRKWSIAGVVVFVIGVIILVAVLAGPSSPPVTETPSPPEEGWIRLRIENVGSIDYPSDFLELQSGDYREFVEEFYLVYEIPSSDFTLQQVGLNELEPSAFDEYRRVIFKTSYLNPGEEVFRANEKYTMSQQELAEIQNEWASQLSQEYAEQRSEGLGDNRIIDPGSVEIVEINGMFPLVWAYKRQLNDNPVVLVKQYVFLNYDKIHSLTFSHRVVDEEECRDIYEKILYSFRLQN